MSDSDYLDAAEVLLSAVEACCDRINDETDADIDSQRVGGMITLSFANKSQIIINLQKPLREVWLATKAGGFHYQFNSKLSNKIDGGKPIWHNSRENTEFFADLSLHASRQSGLELSFSF
jgi:CyaY protein